MADYGLVMSILNKNLSEGSHEFPPVPEERKVPEVPVRSGNYQTRNPSFIMAPSNMDNMPATSKAYDKLKFSFQFDGVTINLLEGNISHWTRTLASVTYYIYIFVYFLAENQGLARFGIYFLSVKGVQLNNGTLKTSIVLCNIQLDDTRESNKSKIRQYLSCKDWQKSVETCVTEQKYMVDVTAIMNPTETFGNNIRQIIHM